MKKLKLINSIVVASTVATPIVFLASCSQDNYANLAQLIKDDQVAIFAELSKCHRSTFDEGEAFAWIKQQFKNDKETYGATLAGEDKWSDLLCVKDQAEIDLPYPVSQKFSTSTYGNMWYDIEPSPGYEEKPKIILHAHVDMTIDWKDDAAKAEWMKESSDGGGVKVDQAHYVDEAYLCSTNNETSLGADNGMGVALLMALAKHRNEFNHPGLRLLFTADESGAVPFLWSNQPEGSIDHVERRMLASGADLLTYDQANGDFAEVRKVDGVYKWQEYKTLTENSKKPFGENYEFGNIISFDGSTRNTIYNSAAGIHECQLQNILSGTVNQQNEAPDLLQRIDKSRFDESTGDLEMYELTYFDLHGGHSGYDINRGHGNALQMLMQTLLTDDPNFALYSVESGGSAYQICNKATAKFVVNKEWGGEFLAKKAQIYFDIFHSSFPNEDKMQYELKKLDVNSEEFENEPEIQVVDPERSRQITIFSNLLLYGPNTWFDEKHEEVKSSCNFGPLTITQNYAEYTANFSYNIVARSADNDELRVFQGLVHAIIDQILYGIVNVDDTTQVNHIDNLVWQPIGEGESNNLAEEASKGYKNIHIKHYKVSSHAWLEIACFPPIFEVAGKAKPDMICYGPEIIRAHSCDEVVYTDSLDGVIKAALYVFNHADRLKSYSN